MDIVPCIIHPRGWMFAGLMMAKIIDRIRSWPTGLRWAPVVLGAALIFSIPVYAARLIDQLEAQYWEPVGRGSVAQADLSATVPAPATIAGGGNFTSRLIYADGFTAIAVGSTLNQTGTLQIVRYMDRAGNVPITAAAATALTANTSGFYSVNDGIPFQSFKVILANTSGSLGTVSNYVLLLNAQ